MDAAAKLPLDVLGYIADVLGADHLRKPNQHAVNALRMLCLTCKFIVPICRRHLFANIRFSTSPGELWWQNERSEFLLSHPIIATHYIRNLYLEARGLFSTSYYDCLQKICDSSSLTSIEISSASAPDWNALPERTKFIIFSLIQVPTLRHLILNRIANFPVAALSLCSGLNRITFRDVYSLSPPGTNDAIQGLTITTLEMTWRYFSNYNNALTTLMSFIGRCTATGSTSIIAFDRLKNATLTIRTIEEFSQMCKLLGRATRLERFEIYVFNRRVRLTELGSSLAINLHPNLRSVTFNLRNYEEEDDGAILGGLNLELRQLSGSNVCEVLEVKAKAALDTPCCSDWIAWATDFDRILTDIGAFPSLCQVFVKLSWLIHLPDEPFPNFDDYPSFLTGAHFPQLLESSEHVDTVCNLYY